MTDEALCEIADALSAPWMRRTRLMAVHNRGEVWLTDLGYSGKTRPCLVLSVPAADRDRAWSQW